MIAKPLVFVSSTSQLDEERRRLREELPRVYELYLFELDRARRTSPERRCREQIERCDVFLGILGTDYGSAFPGEARSIVEWEHDQAASRDDLEILGFVKTPGAGETRDPRQQAFLDRLSHFRHGAWLKAYVTPPELVATARASLEQWLAEFFTAVRERQATLLRTATIPLTVVPTALVVGLVGLVLSSGASRLTSHAMVGLCLSVEALVVLCFVLWLRLSGGQHD
ncbi:MAG: DUF4062 domain-containing protein [Acidobacteria bacterium]|nr:DUF4062 domain-containing protein [Acidobacteriota bacterium]